MSLFVRQASIDSAPLGRQNQVGRSEGRMPPALEPREECKTSIATPTIIEIPLEAKQSLMFRSCFRNQEPMNMSHSCRLGPMVFGAGLSDWQVSYWLSRSRLDRGG